MTVEPGIYRHFKGGLYRVLGEGIQTETREEFVVYYPLSDGSRFPILQCRPTEMFTQVLAGGPRFTKI